MSFMGRLEDFLLPDIFKVISEGRKTGLLTLRIFDVATSTFVKREIWAVDGAIAEVSGSQPATPIEALFRSPKGFFMFNEKARVPDHLDHPVAAHLLTFKALDQITDWQPYRKKYPEPQTSLLQVGGLEPEIKELLRSAPLEANILTYCHGRTSIQQLGQIFNQPLDRIQQAAYRLISANIVEELPIVIIDAPPTNRSSSSNNSNARPVPSNTIVSSPTISSSTVHNSAANTRNAGNLDNSSATSDTRRPAPPKVSNHLLGTLTQFLNQRIGK